MIRLRPKTLQRMLAKAGDAVIEKFEQLKNDPKYYTEKSIRGKKADEESTLGKIERRDPYGRLKSKKEIIDELGKKQGVTIDEDRIDLSGVGTGKVGFDKPDQDIIRATYVDKKGKRQYKTSIDLANQIRNKNPGMTSAQANAIARKRMDKFNLEKGKEVTAKSLGGPQFKKTEFSKFVEKELIPTINQNTTKENKKSNEVLKNYFKDFADRKTGFYIKDEKMSKKFKAPVGAFKKFSAKNSKNWEQIEGGISLKDELANFFETSDFTKLTKKGRQPVQLELDPRPGGAFRNVATVAGNKLGNLKEAQRVYNILQNPKEFQRVAKTDKSIQNIKKLLESQRTKKDLTVKRSDLVGYTLSAIADLQSPGGKLKDEIKDILKEPIMPVGGSTTGRFTSPIFVDPKTGVLKQTAVGEVRDEARKEKLARVRGEYNPLDSEVEELYTQKGMEFETANRADLLQRMVKNDLKSAGVTAESRAEVKPLLKFNYTPAEYNNLTLEDQLTIERATQIYRQAYTSFVQSKEARQKTSQGIFDVELAREKQKRSQRTPVTNTDVSPEQLADVGVYSTKYKRFVRSPRTPVTKTDNKYTAVSPEQIADEEAQSFYDINKVRQNEAESYAEDAVLDAMFRGEPRSKMKTSARVDTGPANRGQPYLGLTDEEAGINYTMEPSYSTAEFNTIAKSLRPDYPTEYDPVIAPKGPSSVQSNISSVLDNPEESPAVQQATLEILQDLFMMRNNLKKNNPTKKEKKELVERTKDINKLILKIYDKKIRAAYARAVKTKDVTEVNKLLEEKSNIIPRAFNRGGLVGLKKKKCIPKIIKNKGLRARKQNKKPKGVGQALRGFGAVNA